MNNSMKVGAALAILSLSAGSAWAATQGVLGATSTGDLQLQLVNETRYKISLLQDITIDDSFAPTFNQTVGVCVFSNEASGNYTVTVDSLLFAGSFLLRNAGIDTIGYNVTWAGNPMTPGTPLAETLGAPSTADDDCAGFGSNVALDIALTPADFNAAPADIYTDTVSVTIAP